jgi:hypothetical protein
MLDKCSYYVAYVGEDFWVKTTIKLAKQTRYCFVLYSKKFRLQARNNMSNPLFF